MTTNVNMVGDTIFADGFNSATSSMTLGAAQILVGSGAPTASVPQGSLYLRTDGSSTSTRAYVSSATPGTWIAITTAS
jgi:hypothetical protein